MMSDDMRRMALAQEDVQVGILFMLDALFLQRQEEQEQEEWRRFNT